MPLDNLIEAGLVAERPKEYDIFRIYRENHPETLAFAPPDTQSRKEIDFTPKPTMYDQLRASTLSDTVAKTVERLQGEADVSASEQKMHQVFDTNAALAEGNVAGAEWRMGRPITEMEVVARRVTKGRSMVGATSEREQALAEAKKDILKAKIRKELHMQEQLRKKYRETAKKLEKQRGKEADDAEAQRIDLATRFNTIFSHLGEDWNADVLEDKDEDELLSIAQDAAEQSDVMREAIDVISPANIPLPDGDDDLESIASTMLAPTIVREAADTELAGERLQLGPPGAPQKKRPVQVAPPNVTTRPQHITPPPYLDDEEERKGPELVLKDPNETIKVDTLDPNYKYTKEQLKQRASQLREKYPLLKQGLLKNISGNARSLRTAIEAVEKLERDGELQEGRGVPKVKSDAPRNPEHYAPFGPRFFINTKKLKAGEFSLVHPSGQKPNIIRNAQLTPALRQVVTNVLDGAPQDTSELSEEEMKWYKWIWAECKLARKADLPIMPKRYLTKKTSHARVKVILGEMVAGNDSPLLLNELESLASDMHKRGWLTKAEMEKLDELLTAQ